MNRFLSIGIIALFIVSTVSPLVIGFSLKEERQVSVLEGTPGIQWIKTFGDSRYNDARSVKQTNDGGYLFVGDVRTGGLDFDAWMVKTDSYGNEQWNKTYGRQGEGTLDHANDVILVSSGGYAFTGINVPNGGDNEQRIWLVKTDEEGNEEWNRSYMEGVGWEIHETIDDGYIIGGTIYNLAGVLLKTDKGGNEEWNRTFWGSPGIHAMGYAIDTTIDGGFVFTGILHGPINPDAFLIKTDSNGNEEINITFSGPDYRGRGESVKQTDDGGYIICGFIIGNSSSAWLVKTDSDGNELWNKTFNKPMIYRDYFAEDCKQTPDGGYALVGWKERFTGDWADSFLIKTDRNGKKEWELTIDGTETFDEVIKSIDLTQDGGYIVVGNEGSPPDAMLVKVGHTPTIKITKPKNALYFFNIGIFPLLFVPRIIGPINVKVKVVDDKYDIEKVEFYLGKDLQAEDTTEPYSWNWDIQSTAWYTLKVVAYNSNGNVGIEEKVVRKFL